MVVRFLSAWRGKSVLIEIDQKDLFSLVNLRTVPSVVDLISVNNFMIGRKAESFRRENHN